MVEQPAQTRRSINQVNSLVRSLVEQEMLEYPFWVSGIVSRYFISNIGHIYFDLTDNDYTISCMLHERRRGGINFELSKGMELEIFGAVRVYEKQAKIQIDVEQIRLIEHDAYVVDGTVQEQLAQRGCWPPRRRSLPVTIERIGVITSRYSDGLHDFETTYRQESGPGAATIQVEDVRIQGEAAPRQIAQAIERLNRDANVDVIALVRGGGRTDELAVYNDLMIAEAICRSDIPVITGIGHQRDDTLADQMADLKTITPTATALELAKYAPQAAPIPHQVTVSNGNNLLVIALFVLAIVIVIVFLLSSGPQ